MPTNLTKEQTKEASEYLARHAGESIVVSGINHDIDVIRPHEMTTITDMSETEMAKYLGIRESLGRSLSVMSKEEFDAVPVSVRQFADNVAFELIIEQQVVDNKADLDMAPYLVAPFVTQSIIEALKESGFTAKSNSIDTVTHGDIRAVMTEIFLNYNPTDTLEETIDAVKQQFSDAGMSFIMPENHVAPTPQPEVKVEVKPEPKVEVKPEPKVETKVETKVEFEPELPSAITEKVEAEKVEAEIKSDGYSALSGETPLIIIPLSIPNNQSLTKDIAASLSYSEGESLGVRAMQIAERLATKGVYMSTNTETLLSLPKDKWIEESAANILEPLEDVEFSATLDEREPSNRQLSTRLLKGMRAMDVLPTIDAKSPELENYTASLLVNDTAKLPEIEPAVMSMKRRTY